MKTGETVETLGLYISECCDEEATFDVGDTFLRCPRCQYACDWEFESEVDSGDNRDPDNGIAA